MLQKAIQILGFSSGLAIQRCWKPRSNRGLSSFAVFFQPSSSFSPSPLEIGSIPPKNPSFLPIDSRRSGRARHRTFRASSSSSAHSDSNPNCPSPSSSPSITVQPTGIRNIKFCQWCGGPAKHDIPHGEERMRAICTDCGKIAYQNPKMVVGCLIEHDRKVLLCRRKIQPSYGLWTLPAGYMEIGESAAEGAIRETREEANAEVEVLSPFSQLDIPLIGQTYIIFLAKLKHHHFSPGLESSECQLFPLEDIPFDSLAFSSMLVTLKLYVEDVKAGKLQFHYGTINKRPGTNPSDIHAYTLEYHLQP